MSRCVALVLAGGRGERLGVLTRETAKPGIYFGGDYRIIDLTLSNCRHSGMDVVGVLSQYMSLSLQNYIGSGGAWQLDRRVFMLPPREGEYIGTSDAVYQNMDFIEQHAPEFVLILCGDHVYRMDYTHMLEAHMRMDADVTIASTSVSVDEAGRFGILETDSRGLIESFEEKPQNPRGNTASMGVYLFKWSVLKRFLQTDAANPASRRDFGIDLIPAMLSAGIRMHAFPFYGYWRDVGTVHSLWQANMDLIGEPPRFDLYDESWEIYTSGSFHSPCYLSGASVVKRSIVSERCKVYGRLENSVVSNSVSICPGAEITDSVIMPGVFIGRNARIHRAVIGHGATIGSNVEIGADCGRGDYIDEELCSRGVSLVAPQTYIAGNLKFTGNSCINRSVLQDEPGSITSGIEGRNHYITA